jgi:hydrogenase maturation protein HypF
VIRVGLSVQGIVQGVGFRPFVQGAATARRLAGWVCNRSDGVRIEVEGPADAVGDFVEVLRHEPPPAARVERIEVTELPPRGARGFRILASAAGAAPRPLLPPDLATCADCAAEIRTRAARRHGYPFTNCTRCGPRYTMIEALPYDRSRTAMRRFPLCAGCAAEYADPRDRRFHAEPIACAACGPRLRLVTADGRELARAEAALAQAARALVAGKILALKGLGGYQLLVDATSACAVGRLRARKRRPHKPFAVMLPSLAAVRDLCAPTAEEERVLASTAAPILLVRRHLPGVHRGANPARAGGIAPEVGAAARQRTGTAEPAGVAGCVAPRNPYLGVMLPTTPLHHLLTAAAGRPLVCTSGNLAEEPLCIDDAEARARLRAVADLFLVHDRPIVRPVDDSVARLGPAGLVLLRRARGFAPLPLRIAAAGDVPCVLALGGQLKSTVALSVGGEVVVSQHLGDLHHASGAVLLERTAADLVRFFDARPTRIACDLHPDYASTRVGERLAARWGVPIERVQHHHAHVAACVAEHGLAGPVLGLAWDGAGLGTDGTLWGGEALVVEGTGFRRVAHLRSFRLPGGARAMREPRRAALGLLHALLGRAAVEPVASMFTVEEARVLVTALERGLNAPETTAVGRLFDAVAALAGLDTHTTFEGQAAMALEFAAAESAGAGAYLLPLGRGEPAVADWEPLVRAVLADRAAGVPAAVIAARFHAALTDLAAAVAARAGIRDVVLSGGCFQNLGLVAAISERLHARGFTVHTPRLYPPNDGGLALGQVLIAIRRAERSADHVPRHPR